MLPKQLKLITVNTNGDKKKGNYVLKKVNSLNKKNSDFNAIKINTI